MNLNEIYDDLFLQILNKVAVRTLCRFRQTCKRIDQILEVHRQKRQITAIHEVNLKIGYSGSSYPELNIIVTTINGRSTNQKIHNPHKQLSSINFRKVHVLFANDDNFHIRYPDSFPALMRKWGLRCEEFRILCAPYHYMDLFLNSVLATKRIISRSIHLRDLPKWPRLKNIGCHFKIKAMDHLSSSPIKELRSIILQPMMWKHDEVRDWVREFLLEIKENRAARGKLQHFGVCNDMGPIFDESDGLTKVYKGSFKHEKIWVSLLIQKIALNSGFALVIQRQRDNGGDKNTREITHFVFFENETREDIYDAFVSFNEDCEERMNIVCTKEEFTKAKDERAAFILIFNKR